MLLPYALLTFSKLVTNIVGQMLVKICQKDGLVFAHPKSYETQSIHEQNSYNFLIISEEHSRTNKVGTSYLFVIIPIHLSETQSVVYNFHIVKTRCENPPL